MVRDIEHCIAIQQRRVADGRRGVAKAVRRFLKRRHRESYLNQMAKLPKRWNNGGKHHEDAAA